MLSELQEKAHEGIQNPREIPAYLRDRFISTRRVFSLPYMMEYEDELQDVEKYCMFIGHGRTGHSLVGSLLNAHPEMVISHELDALKILERSVVPLTQNQLFALILQRDAEFNDLGREWTNYKYDITGTSQGEFETLRVIGDKKGGGSSRILGRNPELLDDLRETLDIPIRVIQVVRNPYDTLASRRQISEEWRDNGINLYFSNANNVERITEMLTDEEFHRVRYEDFVTDPADGLSDLCEFLDVDADEEYLSACADFVFDSPKQTRYEVEWTERQRTRIENRMEIYSWLEDYSFGRTAGRHREVGQ